MTIDLDLDGRKLGPGSRGALTDATKTAPPSKFALALDRWSQKAGERLARENPDGALARLGPEAAADFFGAAFEPEPALAENPLDRKRADYLAELLQTPDYQGLHEDSQADPLISEIAAASLAQSYERHAEKDKEKEKPPPKGRKPPPGKPSPPDPEKEKAELAMACAKAAAAARKEARDAKDSLDALTGGGAGGDGGPGGQTLDAKKAAELYKRVRTDPSLKRIVDAAGAFRRLLRGRRRQKTTFAADERTGVAPTADVRLLLPSELARLAVPGLQADALRRLLAGQALGWDRGGVEKVGKGPVIVCVDESGSMTGPKVEYAKALGLALAWQAKRENRWCALISYSGSTGELLFPLPPGKPWDQAKVLGWLEHFFSGGSSCDLPVKELPRMYRDLGAPPGKTDLLMVTDDELNFPAAWLPPFLQWKKEAKVHATGVVVGGRRGGQLSLLCDTVVRAASLAPDSEAAAAVADRFV